MYFFEHTDNVLEQSHQTGGTRIKIKIHNTISVVQASNQYQRTHLSSCAKVMLKVKTKTANRLNIFFN